MIFLKIHEITRSKFKEFFKFSMLEKHFTTGWYVFISADCHVFVLHLGKTSPGSDPEVACLKKKPGLLEEEVQ